LTLFFFFYAKQKTVNIFNDIISKSLSKRLPLETVPIIRDNLEKKRKWFQYRGDVDEKNKFYMYLGFGILIFTTILTIYSCYFLRPNGLTEILITAFILMIIVFFVEYFIFTKVALYYNPILSNELADMTMKIINQKVQE
jgi:hypothetical protein